MQPIQQLVELGIYAEDLAAAEQFYRNVLGLRVVGREEGRHVFFAVGDAMLLIFNPRSTLKGDILPPHGSRGPAHFALGVGADSLDQWRAHLEKQGVAIEKEMTWPRGGRSLYFRDPAGNSVELVTKGLWGLPSGW
jgi:catechol 2,3-dioxygenase-like lactoylglutathione lyase family enzyme